MTTQDGVHAEALATVKRTYATRREGRRQLDANVYARWLLACEILAAARQEVTAMETALRIDLGYGEVGTVHDVEVVRRRPDDTLERLFP